MATKHEADEVDDRVAGINRIKTEPSGDDPDKCDVDSKEPIKTMSELESPTTSGIVEQVFVKTENDPDSGGTALPSIKSEPPGDEWDKCIAEDKSILEMEAENYKLDMEMSGQVKSELLIKKEWDDDPAAVYEVSASRIKEDADRLEAGPAGGVKEEADMDDEEYQLTEDCDIKSESDASMDAASDEPSNSIEKNIFSRKQDQVIYESIGSKLFRCYICNYTVFNKHHLIDHMIVHDSKKYVPDHTKRNPSNANASVSSETEKFWTCGHCDATFRDKRGLDQHIIRKHPGFISSVTCKVHECTKCTFKTVVKGMFDRHLLKHPEVASDLKLSTCIHCNATFKSNFLLNYHVVREHPDFATFVTSKVHECTKCTFKTVKKIVYDNHVIRKHPEVVTSVTSKLHECTKCTFKTVIKTEFDRHLLKHPEVASDFKLSTCNHCNATFKSKLSLDNHVVKKHPNFVTSVTSKLFECTKCTFKTVIKTDFNKHLLNHPEVASNFKLRTCIHCNATLKSKLALDNHLVRKHPDFITSVTRKLFECTKCTFKTVMKIDFNRHLLKHPEVASDFKLSTCTHCNATFKSKLSLDNHVVRKHPDFVSSVTSKLFECAKCTFKTVKKTDFDKHLLKHPGVASSFMHRTCIHCNAKFKSKLLLDNHVVRKHPEFVTSVTSKLHECTECTFKTVIKTIFDKHLLKHPEVASNFMLRTCIHCNATFKSKLLLDNHVLRKHPEFVTSVTSKVHECTKCTFKTAIKTLFDKHLLKHPKVASDSKLRSCIH